MHRQVGVPLARTLLGVAERRIAHHLPVHHLLLAERQRTQRLRQQLTCETFTVASPVRVRISAPRTPTQSRRS
jgi:hypothetical protein